MGAKKKQTKQTRQVSRAPVVAADDAADDALLDAMIAANLQAAGICLSLPTHSLQAFFDHFQPTGCRHLFITFNPQAAGIF